jgi:hypothetical protein
MVPSAVPNNDRWLSLGDNRDRWSHVLRSTPDQGGDRREVVLEEGRPNEAGEDTQWLQLANKVKLELDCGPRASLNTREPS